MPLAPFCSHSLQNDAALVCQLIDQLFPLDRNMEAELSFCHVTLSHALVLEVLHRFRHARKPAFRFFNWAAKQDNYLHNSITYNAMMSVLARSRQYESMVSLLEEMGERDLLNLESFWICIKGFAMGRERRKAVGVIETMRRYKFECGGETMRFLVDSLGRANLAKEAEVVFRSFESFIGGDLSAYTVLLRAWCRVKDVREAGRVWNEMVAKGIEPDTVAYNVMIEGLVRCHKRSDAIKLFELMKAKGPPPDVLSYTLFIRELCKGLKMEEARELFDEMVGRGCKPDVAVYTCLISGYGSLKRMDTVCEILRSMEEAGCPPDGVTYNVLIKALARGKAPEEAMMMLRKMRRSGNEPTIHSNVMIMKSFFQVKNFAMGREVWEEMKRSGVCADEAAYEVLIRGLIGEGKGEEAVGRLEEMVAKGMSVPRLDYGRLAVLVSKGGKSELLDELARKMKAVGHFDATHVMSMSARCRAKHVEFLDWLT